MPRVILIAFDGAQTLDVAGPAEVFAGANRRLGREVYRVVFTARGKRSITTTAGCTMATRRLETLRHRADDTVLVSGGEEAGVRAAVGDEALLAWLRRAEGACARVGSVCSGAFVLAAAGILDGKRAATHWSGCDQLAKFRPAVQVDREAIFVRDGKVWTSAGVTTGIDMALAMVERDVGAAVADAVAARLVLYVRRPGFQSQFSEALVAQSEGADALGPALAWARGHLRELNVPRLAKRAGMSVRTLHRRCAEQLNTTPARVIERLRVEHARALLAGPGVAAKLAAAQSGFGSAARMNAAFKRTLGVGAREARALAGGRNAAA